MHPGGGSQKKAPPDRAGLNPGGTTEGPSLHEKLQAAITLLKGLFKCFKEQAMLKADGFDEAIIGQACIWRNQGMHNVLVYDAEKMRSILMKRDGMDADEAREYIEFNVEGAYVGDETPVYVWTEDYLPE